VGASNYNSEIIRSKVGVGVCDFTNAKLVPRAGLSSKHNRWSYTYPFIQLKNYNILDMRLKNHTTLIYTMIINTKAYIPITKIYVCIQQLKIGKMNKHIVLFSFCHMQKLHLNTKVALDF